MGIPGSGNLAMSDHRVWRGVVWIDAVAELADREQLQHLG